MPANFAGGDSPTRRNRQRNESAIMFFERRWREKFAPVAIINVHLAWFPGF